MREAADYEARALLAEALDAAGFTHIHNDANDMMASLRRRPKDYDFARTRISADVALRAIAAALKQGEAGREWQPIATFPKDFRGYAVFGWWFEHLQLGRSWETTVDPLEVDDGYITHWMSLAAPPPDRGAAP